MFHVVITNREKGFQEREERIHLYIKGYKGTMKKRGKLGEGGTEEEETRREK